ncbi:tryptophan--tRNA ligase [Ureaplasma miroungigenitalium]|uniref:Tryptophan--tRNA ligase n=1 Tax=Ureaplasma miroungigenitalium TaxID=1042321 RepID=A0ABT3BML9_9BACT|nr:tryptophan--tRNA ligase [Ureaplasma miroungigenitalium]MCV3728476.1 tryptophan--tRNA ligase [Ureaplasma miroungigenitalium]MCV3734263.1 tryptophan--tRNA ligase [Ureaplasma miroungigenitalium]
MKKRLLSGIQPTNNLTLGNFLGAICNFVNLQNEFEVFLFVADLHSLTTQEPLPKNFGDVKRSIIATYLAAGIDMQKATLFFQSSVNSIPLLSHILLCMSNLGELERMTQFKDKSQKVKKQENNTISIPTGLLTYPLLMAADILAFNADLIPVGADQKQHMELAQSLAERFNKRYKVKHFHYPQTYINQTTAKIMDLQDPSKKMSKSSENPKGTLFLSDDKNTIIKKIRAAVTDSLNQVKYDPEEQPGVSNLIVIYHALTNKPISEIEKMYDGSNYGIFKNDLAEIVANFIEDLQTKINYWLNSEELDVIIEKSNEKASETAEKIVNETMKLMYLK